MRKTFRKWARAAVSLAAVAAMAFGAVPAAFAAETGEAVTYGGRVVRATVDGKEVSCSGVETYDYWKDASLIENETVRNAYNQFDQRIADAWTAFQADEDAYAEYVENYYDLKKKSAMEIEYVYGPIIEELFGVEVTYLVGYVSDIFTPADSSLSGEAVITFEADQAEPESTILAVQIQPDGTMKRVPAVVETDENSLYQITGTFEWNLPVICFAAYPVETSETETTGETEAGETEAEETETEEAVTEEAETEVIAAEEAVTEETEAEETTEEETEALEETTDGGGVPAAAVAAAAVVVVAGAGGGAFYFAHRRKPGK